MPQWLAVKLLAVELPQRHEAIHMGDETLVMMALEQVNHFMDNDVLQAMHGFLDEFEIQPDATCLNIAGTPAGFHLFHAPASHLHANDRFPFGDKGRNLFFEAAAVPGGQYAPALRGITGGAGEEVHDLVVANDDG